VVLNRRHLTRVLKNYFVYYHCSRTHLALAKDTPEPRPIIKRGRIEAIPKWAGYAIATSVLQHDRENPWPL